MKQLGKHIVSFFVLVFVMHGNVYGQFMHHAVTLKKAYSYQEIDSLSNLKLETLNIQLNRETIDFLSTHKNYSILDFKNLKSLRVESVLGEPLINGYPADFINNLNEEDTRVFQDWLDGISALDSITDLFIPSFFKIGKIESLSNLNLAYYKYVDSSFFSNFQNVKELWILSSTLKNEHIDFDFTNFRKLKSLSLSLHSKDIKTFNLPDLKHCRNLNAISIAALKSDSVIIKGLLYGNTLSIITDQLKLISFTDVFAVNKLNYFEVSGSLIEDYDFSGLIANSDSLKFNFRFNTCERIDFDKFPKKSGYELINIDANGLTEILFPSVPFSVNSLSLRSQNLENVPIGIHNLQGLKKVAFYTPNLNSLADDLYSLKELERLSIFHSNLDRIPENIENMHFCTTLLLNVNRIRRSDLKRLGRLNTLTTVTIYESQSSPEESRKVKKHKGAFLKRHLPSAEINIYK